MKKNVFFLELGAIAVIVIIVLIAQYHQGELCRYVNENGHTTEYCGIILFSLFPIILLLPFSAVLYFTRDEIFTAWWNFARWFVPVIVIVTLLLENAGGGGGYLGMDQDFTAFILIALYSIFVLVSLVKITRMYLKTKSH